MTINNCNLSTFQLTIEARDGDFQTRTDTGLLTINIVGNQGPPVFTQNNNYFQSIDESLSVTESVLIVSAVDQDAPVSQINTLAFWMY